jgi:hypothetical protein
MKSRVATKQLSQGGFGSTAYTAIAVALLGGLIRWESCGGFTLWYAERGCAARWNALPCAGSDGFDVIGIVICAVAVLPEIAT